MEVKDVLKITRSRLNATERAYEKDYYQTISELFTQVLREQKVTMFCGIKHDGVEVYKVPMLNKYTPYASILHVVSEIIHRLGLRYSDYISSYFMSKERQVCKACEHRAEYMAHGLIIGLGVGLVLMVVEGLVLL